MTTPTGAADERERLTDDLSTYAGMILRDPKYRYVPKMMSDAADMLRADAGLANKLECLEEQHAALVLVHAAQQPHALKAKLQSCEEALAAQSAELERVRKGMKQVGYLITWNNPMYRGPQTISFDPCDDDAGTCAPVYTLATPSAAGGEKEGC